MQIDPCLSSFTTLKFKWTKDFNLRPDTLNLIEEKVRNSVELVGTGKDFPNRTQRAKAVKMTINEYDLIKLKSFL